MKKIFLKICIYATIICVLVSVFAAPAFATGDVVQFTEAAKLGATVIDLYGMANNTSLAYDVASTGSALTVIENLYQDYATNASDPYTLAAIGAALAAAGAVAVVYDAVTGQGYIQLYQEQYISSMDGYWDYQLTDAGLVRDSLTGLFSWSLNQQDTVTPITVFLESSASCNGVTLYPLPVLGSYNNKVTTISGDSNVVCFAYQESDPSWCDYILISVDNNPFSFVQDKPWDNSTIPGTSQNPVSQSGNRYFNIVPLDHYFVPNVPLLPNHGNGLSTLTYYLGDVNSNPVVVSNEDVSLTPSWGDPLNNPLEITIPDNTAPDYVPTPRRITTNIPWDPTWGDPLPDGVSEPEYGVPYPITDPALLNTVVPEIWDDVVANDVQVQPDPQPSDPDTPTEEVYLPFLPLEVPSFNFSLSGIWHYVVTWVQSLGSWFNALFAMWSCLPYAMVVPVYATLVVVIVLGLYKRFIA